MVTEFKEIKYMIRGKILNYSPILISKYTTLEFKYNLRYEISNIIYDLIQIIKKSKLDLKNKKMLIDLLNILYVDIKLIIKNKIRQLIIKKKYKKPKIYLELLEYHKTIYLQIYFFSFFAELRRLRLIK